MGIKKKTVLLVEDDVNLQALVKTALEEKKYNVICAFDGVQALELLKEDPDIIWLDLYMPRMNGMEFMDQLREDKEHATTPIIVVTVSRSQAEIAQAKEGVNVCGFFLKSSMSLDDIVVRMEDVLRKCAIK